MTTPTKDSATMAAQALEAKFYIRKDLSKLVPTEEIASILRPFMQENEKAFIEIKSIVPPLL